MRIDFQAACFCGIELCFAIGCGFGAQTQT